MIEIDKSQIVSLENAEVKLIDVIEQLLLLKEENGVIKNYLSMTTA
jgi:hypothetical protein